MVSFVVLTFAFVLFFSVSMMSFISISIMVSFFSIFISASMVSFVVLTFAFVLFFSEVVLITVTTVMFLMFFMTESISDLVKTVHDLIWLVLWEIVDALQVEVVETFGVHCSNK